MGIETIIRAPAKMWLADADTAHPDIDTLNDSLGSDWNEFGNSYWADGSITVTSTVETIKERIDSSQYVQKAFNGNADISASGIVKDFSLETLAHFFNGNAVVEVAAGTDDAGYREMDLEVSITKQEYAVLIRFYTPYNSSGLDNAEYGAQIWLPRVVFESGLGAGLSGSNTAENAFVISAMESDTLGIGKMRFKDADATG